MSKTPKSLDRLTMPLVRSLSRTLSEQFNVLRVMHHGTHEKQLSNVFAWLLREDATHGLGRVGQRLLVAAINADLPEPEQIPDSGYRVVQEVNTTGRTTSRATLPTWSSTDPRRTSSSRTTSPPTATATTTTATSRMGRPVACVPPEQRHSGAPDRGVAPCTNLWWWGPAVLCCSSAPSL